MNVCQCRFTHWYTYDHNATNLALSKKSKDRKLIPVLLVFAVYGFVCGDNTLQMQADNESNKAKINDIVHLQNFRKNIVDSVAIHVINSCAPDSLFQALSCLYVDNEKFRELCTLKKNEISNNRVLDLLISFTKKFYRIDT